MSETPGVEARQSMAEKGFAHFTARRLFQAGYRGWLPQSVDGEVQYYERRIRLSAYDDFQGIMPVISRMIIRQCQEAMGALGIPGAKAGYDTHTGTVWVRIQPSQYQYLTTQLEPHRPGKLFDNVVEFASRGTGR